MLKRVYDTISTAVSLGKSGKLQQQPDKVMGGAHPPGWIKTTYESNDISIPDDFLIADPADAQPIEVEPVDVCSSNFRPLAGGFGHGAWQY